MSVFKLQTLHHHYFGFVGHVDRPLFPCPGTGIEGVHNPSGNGDRVSFDFAFPHPNDGPPCLLGALVRVPITHHIPRHLLHPLFGIWAAKFLPAVFRAPMPEASVNKHADVRTRESDVE